MKKILGFDCHSALWSAYAKLGYDIDLMHYNDNFAWDKKEKPIPENVRILPAGSTINHKEYFIAIGNNEHTQAPILRGLGVPYVLALASCSHIRDMNRIQRDRVVFCGHAQRSKLGFSTNFGDVLYYPIDTDKFSGWTGIGGYSMSMVRHMRKAQGQGFERYKQIRLAIGERVLNFGRQADGLSMDETGSEESTIAMLQKAACYFDPVDVSPLSFACLEALAVGVPFVTTKHDEWPILLENEKSAFICKDNSEIIERIKYCFENKTEAGKVGALGRDVIREKCTLKNWKTTWERIFDEMRLKR